MSRSPSPTPATPTTKDDVLAIRRLDVLLSVFRYTRQFPSNIVPTVTVTSTVMEDGAESECDTSSSAVVLLDRRVCRVTGYLVHSDIVGKVLSLLRAPLIGRHVKTLPIATSMCYGVAVNASETLMALTSSGNSNQPNMLFLYSLPGGELLKTIGSDGPGPGQFQYPWRVCFGPGDTILVADSCNWCIREFTATGERIRGIEVHYPFTVCISHNGQLIAAGNAGAGLVSLFHYDSCALIREFGRNVARQCINGTCFTPDDACVLVTSGLNCVLQFAVSDGTLVRELCHGYRTGGMPDDVTVTPYGEIILTHCKRNVVSVYSEDGSELIQSIGNDGLGDEQLNTPIALAYASASGRLYVLESMSPRVQVFE